LSRSGCPSSIWIHNQPPFLQSEGALLDLAWFDSLRLGSGGKFHYILRHHVWRNCVFFSFTYSVIHIFIYVKRRYPTPQKNIFTLLLLVSFFCSYPTPHMRNICKNMWALTYALAVPQERRSIMLNMYSTYSLFFSYSVYINMKNCFPSYFYRFFLSSRAFLAYFTGKKFLCQSSELFAEKWCYQNRKLLQKVKFSLFMHCKVLFPPFNFLCTSTSYLVYITRCMNEYIERERGRERERVKT
jgi:hypothetical protein